MKPQYCCARLVLAKEFNAAFSQIFRPSVADSLVAREVARRGDDQARPSGVKKSIGAGLSGMMLTFNDDVALKIQMARQQCLFRLDAAVRHEQDPGRRCHQQMNDIRLIISGRRAEIPWREQEVRSHVLRQMETVSLSQIVQFDSAISKQTLQFSMRN